VCFYMEGYRGWALHCLENRWIAEAVGVRFYHPSSNMLTVQFGSCMILDHFGDVDEVLYNYVVDIDVIK